VGRLSDFDSVDSMMNSSESEYLVEIGRQKEKNRILTIIELDLLTSTEVKERLKALVNGGTDSVES